MESEVKSEEKDTGKDSPSPLPRVDVLEPQQSRDDRKSEDTESEPVVLKGDSGEETKDETVKTDKSAAEKTEKDDETLILKMNDGRTVACQLVCDGKEKYLKEISLEDKTENQTEPKMTSDNKQSSFSRSSQFVSSVNSLLEENSSKVDKTGESYKRSTLELFEPIPSRLLKNHPHGQQWTEQGRRLASFVEDSIYRSLKSNDADVVKEWQLKMNSESFHSRLLDETKRDAQRLSDNVSSDVSVPSRYQPTYSLDDEHPSVSTHQLAGNSNIAKNGKVSLLDVLREKLRRTLLNYDQQVKHDSHNATRSIDTLFFSPAVESTTPDSQSAMPSSSDDVFGMEEPPYGFCDGDSGSNSTDESCSDRPSSTQSLFPASSSKSESGTFPEVECSVAEGVLDLSCSSQKSKGSDASKRKRPSTSDFSLERILARPDPKPKQKHNPFMQTFSDLLDLPPREIKNREPFKVKRRPYRRRRGTHQGPFKPSDGPGGSEMESGASYDGTGSRPGLSTSNQAPIGYLAITEDEYQRSLATATGSPDADWPSVALLMNVYSEWKLKNRGITPGSPLASELGAHGMSIPGLAAGLSKSSPPSTSPPPTQRSSSLSESASHHTSCSSDCSSRSAGQFYSKKSRLLQNVARNCSCKSHSRKVGHPGSVTEEEVTKSSIRSLLNEERMEKKQKRREAVNSEDRDSDTERRVKRPRVPYREDGEVPLSRDPDGQGVCVIS